MPKILTPLSLWNNFDLLPETSAVTLSCEQVGDMTVERIKILGRETEAGRIEIAAAFAYDSQNPAKETVMVLPDSSKTIDYEVLELFVSHGYSALMIDYRGEWENCDFYTKYPEDIGYANLSKCGRYKDYVDDSADKTSWYEWVGVGIYAHKYLSERVGENIALVGIRDGGEIAWKLAAVKKFECLIPICAAGWRAYAGVRKYLSEEPTLDDERYRFIAGIDSQAYAPYVQCPVLMLCSTNDMRFDYDRAYDTFSRINAEFVNDSVITFSVQSNASIGAKSTADMFMFLDRNLKNRQVFIPKPCTVSVEVDAEDNLIAKACFDDQGVVESCKVYLSEDCTESAFRDWLLCPFKCKSSSNENEFYLNIYEKTSTIFVFCHARYSNGFTVWSKMVVKKISGKFRNMQSRCRVLYSNKMEAEGFSIADPQKWAVGGVFLTKQEIMPELVEKANGISGLYSECGLCTFRMNNPRYAATDGSSLSLDVFCDTASDLTISILNLATGDEYVYTDKIVGGVWQSLICEASSFKTAGGISFTEFNFDMQLTIKCKSGYAINNIMWL